MSAIATGVPRPAIGGAKHWLVKVAERARLAGASDLDIAFETSLTDAWDAVSRALGLSAAELAARLAPTLGVGVANFESAQRQSRRLVPEKLARRLQVFPLTDDDRTIVVATSNAGDLDAEQAIGFASGRRVVFMLGAPSAIGAAIDTGYNPDRSVARLLERVDSELRDSVRVVEELAPELVAEQEVLAGPVVKLTDLVLHDAVMAGASDIHIEPGPQRGSVRFRIDGVMRRQMQLPAVALNRVVARIKVLSKLDIANRLRPQDGRARIEIDGKTYDLRVSTVPTREAEKVVIRILRPDSARGLQDCGLDQQELVRVRRLLSHRDGIVLVTGPTGSGKTTTLYSALKEVATEDLNVMTVEDPIEYELSGVTQMQVEPKRNVTFASALRAILRQDPDVIFIGEIRDAETAQVAAQAALTGHLVLATLHTNDAVSTIARLSDLGLERSTIASTLRGAVAQRLVRRVCTECATPISGELTEQELRLSQTYGARPTVRAVGCRSCANTGYRGRQPVVEVAVVTKAMSEQIALNASVAELQRAAVEGGMRGLRAAALARAVSGDTTLQEVERVLGDVREDSAAEPESSGRSSVVPRILIVDDDEVIRHLATVTLQSAGYETEAVDDGDLALVRLAPNEHWDLVLSDMEMARIGGEQLLNKIRSQPHTQSIPVIVLTGTSDEAKEITMIDAGASDYLRKPLDPPRLVARVKAALRRRGS